MSDNKKLMENLKKLRKEYNLTQDEVSALICKERSCVAKYESGKIVPPLPILALFAKLYNVTVDELCGISSPSKAIAVKSEKEKNDASVVFSHLSKQEQIIILKLRMLSKEEKNKIIGIIDSLTSDKESDN